MTAAENGGDPIRSDERDVLLAPLLPFPAIVLAVSGGPDSTALLQLVHGWAVQQKRAPESLIAVTVDHGLRPESAAEAEAVARQARGLGIAHRTVRWAGPAPATGLQAAARAARYRLLVEVAREKAAAFSGRVAIATAHTADDQAETLIMRLARGSGVDGLASIPPRSAAPVAADDGGDGMCVIVRPLLGVPRGRLLATLAASATPFADDPSNRDRRFERVRVREALAVLEGLGVTREALQRSARRLQSAREVLERAADDLEARAVTSIGSVVYDIDREALASASVETAVRVLRRVLARAGGAAPPADLGAIEAAAARLLAAPDVPAFTLGGCIVETVRAAGTASGMVRIYREPDRDGGLPRLEVAPGEAARWDERFEVAVGAESPGSVEVGPLAEDWPLLVAEIPALSRLGLPRAAARGIPAFRSRGKLLAVPVLADLLRDRGEPEAARRLAGLAESGPDEFSVSSFSTRPIRPQPSVPGR